MSLVYQSEAERQQLRWRCMTDLKFLAVDIFDYTKINDRMHGPVFDFYGAYDPRPRCLACGQIYLMVDEKQCVCGSDRRESQQDVWQRQVPDGIKDDMQLDPRGTFKSTLVMCRCVQAIICFPDITIAYISAASNLPGDFVNAIQKRFLLRKEFEPTPFQQLFPEFCMGESKYRDGYFTVPTRRRIDPLPTMMSTSIESSTSGIHPWMMVLDDLVDNRNTQNPQVIRKVNKNVSLLMYTRMAWTHVAWRGTRYSPIDAYGERMRKIRQGKVKLLVRSAWTPKPGKEDIPVEDLQESDVDLLFPEEFPFAELAARRDDNLELFCAQMLNDPLGAQHGTFDPVKVAAAIKPFSQMPVSGPAFIAWRFAYEDGLYYSAGAVGILDGFRMAIVDCLRGSWKPSRLAFKVVELAKKWGVRSIEIEETPGARSYEEAIKASAIAQSWPVDISWRPFTGDKVTRSTLVTRMEPLVNATRLIFADHIKIIDTVRDQLVQFGMSDEKEIPEAVSLLIDRIPKLDLTAAHLAQESMDLYQKLKEMDLHNRIYAIGQYAQVAPPPPPPKPAPNPYALDDIMPGLNG